MAQLTEDYIDVPLHEIGANILASMAYADETQWELAFQNACAIAIRNLYDGGDVPVAMNPEHAFAIVRGDKRFRDRIEARLYAADLLMPLLQAVAGGDKDLPAQAALVDRYIENDPDIDGGEPGNLWSRLVPPAMENLHWALACAVVFQRRQMAGETMRLSQMLHDRELLHEVVGEAINACAVIEKAFRGWKASEFKIRLSRSAENS